MTRKDFQLIAETVAQVNCDAICREKFAYSFARVLAQTNPRFNSQRFVAACGVES